MQWRRWQFAHGHHCLWRVFMPQLRHRVTSSIQSRRWSNLFIHILWVGQRYVWNVIVITKSQISLFCVIRQKRICYYIRCITLVIYIHVVNSQLCRKFVRWITLQRQKLFLLFSSSLLFLTKIIWVIVDIFNIVFICTRLYLRNAQIDFALLSVTKVIICLVNILRYTRLQHFFLAIQ